MKSSRKLPSLLTHRMTQELWMTRYRTGEEVWRSGPVEDGSPVRLCSRNHSSRHRPLWNVGCAVWQSFLGNQKDLNSTPLFRPRRWFGGTKWLPGLGIKTRLTRWIGPSGWLMSVTLSNSRLRYNGCDTTAWFPKWIPEIKKRLNHEMGGCYCVRYQECFQVNTWAERASRWCLNTFTFIFSHLRSWVQSSRLSSGKYLFRNFDHF